MAKNFFKCPECGYPLSCDLIKDKKGQFKMEFFCEGVGDDLFHFEIATGLTNNSIAKLVVRKDLKKDVVIKLIERKSGTEQK